MGGQTGRMSDVDWFNYLAGILSLLSVVIFSNGIESGV